jgi:hypothetical protein
MPVDHTPLDVNVLGEQARRALTGPMRKMAARGLAPISEPTELLAVLYQLALDPDAELRGDAERSAGELPERVVQGALASPSIDARVLDFFVRRVLVAREPLLEIAAQNPVVSPETLVHLAAQGSARLVDVIADNQRQLLEHPAIIGAMYTNPRARMSTVDRAVELAVRSDVKVPGIAAWEEVASAVLKAPAGEPAATEAADALFATAAMKVHAGAGGGEIAEVEEEEPSGEEEKEEIPLSQMTVPQKIRLATLGNAFIRSTLIRDAIRPVALAAIKAPTVTEVEVKKYAGNTSLHEDVIKYIASRRDWTKSYAVKFALVQNAKTPLPASMRLLPHLRERDVRFIAKSKGVPSALAAQARKLIAQRGRGG